MYAARGLPLVARITFGVVAILVLCVGGGTILVHQIVTAKFRSTETELVLRNRAVVQSTVGAEVDHLRFITNDWAHWDDFHEFVAGRNPKFAAAELGGRAVERLSLDALLVIGLDGQVINAEFNPAIGGNAAAIAATTGRIAKSLSAASPSMTTMSVEPIAGLLDTASGTFALASHPIVRTDASGVPNGTLVMARRVDPDRLTAQLSVLPAQVRLIGSGGEDLPPALHQLAESLVNEPDAARLVLGEAEIADYQLFRDINGKPAFLLESRTQRSIAATGREATKLIAIIALAAAAVALLTLVLMLRHLVTQRITTLTDHIQEMRAADTEQPVPGCDQGDEIGTLAQEFDALIRAHRADEAALLRLAAAVEHAGDAISIMDRSGHITYVNPQYERQKGYMAVEVLGKGPSHGCAAPDRYAELWATVDGGKPWHGLLESRRKNGSTIQEDVTVAPIRSNDGEVTSYVAVMRDVTASREAEAEIRKLAAAAENAADAVVILNMDGRIEYCNPAYERHRQMTLSELYGRHPSEIGKGLDRPEHYASIWRSVSQGQSWAGEVNTERLDGKVLVEELVLAPIRGEDGVITNYVGVLHDVTGRRQLETQLAQARRLEAVGQLAAGVAHEINTPIQYVGDNIRFLEESFSAITALVDRLHDLAGGAEGRGLAPAELASALDAAEIEYLRTEVPSAIRQSLEGVERVAEIVHSMKELAHPARDLVAVDLNRVVRSAVTVAGTEWKPEAQLVSHFDPSLPQVPCLPGAINQVIVNMLVNAAHAIAESRGPSGPLGTITVSTRTNDGYAEIEVRDSGAGMTAEVQERVFDPFFTTKPVGKGTGQGLAIAHAVIKKHGGEIRVASEPGRGSIFTVRLPLVAQTVAVEVVV